MALRGLLGALAPAVLTGALVAVPQAAQASIGVGIQPGPVQLSGAAHPGQSVALPPVAVVDAGTGRETIWVTVQRDPRGGGLPVPPSWVRPVMSSVQLARRHAIRIPLELVVPAGAKPGFYVADIVATASGPASAHGANLGAAAATLLEFRVTPDPAPGFWWSVFTQTLWALLILIALVAVVLVVRRSGLRVRVERESAGYGPADEYGGTHA